MTEAVVPLSVVKRQHEFNLRRYASLARHKRVIEGLLSIALLECSPKTKAEIEKLLTASAEVFLQSAEDLEIELRAFAADPDVRTRIDQANL